MKRRFDMTWAKSYKVVEGESIKQLQQRVDALLWEGWQCQGGIACQGSHTFYQAMVKR